ncbi:hypothetical protein DOE59_18880 [Salmonella enterica subsp. diarizonae serovar 48:i:z]|uniref:Uncharacterized protein n=1 Tax=Salmonella enterica subsp. diarizonae serovar 48:i:z TaxID=1192842 RepID=A0A7U6BEF7_SALDZ|nr:hypothetical protein [Salmonella enterica]EAW2211419.1 hypothetical protein [Salmonella enterica subsp. enterica]EBW8396638.1 hypothetical protein [Salmonella enterica subsp. enterica serovar Florida]AXC73442.1 hypothetical protein DOE59_18880 [Salmonella enterica subsp. diarizonae serovar 48:i:z]ECF5772321.1 hypothetical protein [Salmonella enterica]ECR9437857.1 hypothetical protein [Salmonella enterica]
MSDFVVPQLPFLDLPRAVETIRAAGGWLHCEERDLITLWKSGSIELCFSVPDWIACADMDFPGKGSDVLLSVEYGSFMRWWAEEPYSWPPPPNEVTMQFRRYGTTDPYREMKLSAWADMRLSPDYQPVDDSGERLANALRAMYSSKALVIPRAELVKAIGIFTSTLPDDVRESCAAAGKTESQKSVNYLARQLKALICIHYGADVADKLKKYLDDPDSEIRKDFASKGLKAPGGKALQRHLENVDVETLDDDK